MPKVSLKLEIAGRTYPISVLESEQQRVMEAASTLNEAINSLKKQYAVNDLQDLMAMASLQLILKSNQNCQGELQTLESKLENLVKEFSSH
ncbi:MAG: cell division protein ZapA [Bacteroidetes bacterium]|nr:cell division protein ZapA [Bacteroidota bacterium]MBM3424876.1 cell division protein ZapA [Bacteroidota bacterium]